MGKGRSTSMEASLPLVFSLVFSLMCPCVLAVFCSPSCICVFDDVLEDNMATCQFSNSSLQVTWSLRHYHTTLFLRCSNTYSGQIYDCAEFPEFQLSNDDAWVHVFDCSPSILKCINKMFAQPSRVTEVEVSNMVGEYTSEDMASLTHVDRFKIYLTNDDVDMPSVAINSLVSMRYCIITGGNLHLSSNVFEQNKLEYFQLHLNNIRGLPPYTFNGLPNLKFLEIRGNYFETLGANSFTGLHSVEDIVIENNTLVTIDPDAFSNVKQITTLYLKNNRMKLVPNGLFTELKKLYKIRITMNQVEMALDTHVFADLPPSITVVDVPTSRVRHLPEYLFNGSSNIHQLYFHRNEIEALPPKLFATTTGLRYIDFSENKIKELPDKIFSAMPKLEHINLGYNYISSLRGDLFTHSSHFKEIYINNNRIVHMDRDIFKGAKLNSLSAASNKLRRIIGNTPLEWRTNKLDLSDNELEVFEDWFSEVNGLQILNLSMNKIETIKEMHIYHSSKTKLTIDLRNNSLSQIVRDSDISKSQTPTDITIYLANNPLSCDCTVTTLLKEWQKYGILADAEEVTCYNGELLSNLDIYIQCNKTHALIALIGSSVVGTLILVLIIISIFTHRHDIWEFITNLLKFHNTPVNLKGADNSTFEMTEETAKPYDLFISFAHQDAEFVIDKLLPILEKDFGLKVCVHYRDWAVGDLIPDQIKISVTNSTMTMIILTEHFLQSQWSNLEFRTAHNLSIEDGTPRVIIVLLDESITRDEKMSIDIKSYIDVNTYLNWEDQFFWDKLQKILPKYNKNKLKKKSLK